MVRKKKGKGWKVAGWTISIGLFSFLVVFFTFKAYGILYEDWFAEHAMWIAIIGTILIVIFVILGIIKISAIARTMRKGY